MPPAWVNIGTDVQPTTYDYAIAWLSNFVLQTRLKKMISIGNMAISYCQMQTTYVLVVFSLSG